MTSPQERIAIAIGNFAHAMETNNADGAGSTELRQETREALHTLFTELAAERDAATTARDGMERIAEQSRRDGQEIAAGLHERIAELERELAAAKGKLAALLDASKAGSELVEDLYGYAITDWAWKYGPEWLAQRDAFRSAIAAAEQGGA